MTTLEESLREMFADRVESTPQIRDPAAAAIRRGRVIRRRQTAGSTVAAAMALLITIGGVTALGGTWRSGQGTQAGSSVSLYDEPADQATTVLAAGPANDTRIGLDLRVGDRLWTTDGRRLLLTGVGEVTRIYRVPDGWVYAGVNGVRFLRADGTSIALSGEDDRWALSPAGDQFAFAVGTVLYTARLKPTGLAVRASVQVPATTEPVAFLGDQVVVRVVSAGFDLLDPARPRYEPRWNPEITAVLGVHADEVAALVQPAGEPWSCLADLRSSADGLRISRDGGCDLGLEADLLAERFTVRLSPDGGWLARFQGGQVTLLDWDRTVDGQPTSVRCPVRATAEPVWADARTVVTGDERGVVRCRVDGSQQVVALPAGVGTGWQLVPRLTAATGSE